MHRTTADLLRITVDDPSRLLALVDDVDVAAEESAGARGHIAALIEADARTVPDIELLRAVDAAARTGEGPAGLQRLATRVAHLEVTWDDVLDVRRPATDPDVADARAALLDTGFSQLAQLDLSYAIDESH